MIIGVTQTKRLPRRGFCGIMLNEKKGVPPIRGLAPLIVRLTPRPGLEPRTQRLAAFLSIQTWHEARMSLKLRMLLTIILLII